MTTSPEPAQRIIFPARGEVALQEFELPPTGPDCVRARSLCSLVSIGTESTILWQRYAPDSHFARLFSFPQLQTGVQTLGRVEACGAEVTDFTVGDLVYLRRGHGSHHVVSAAECSPVPAGAVAEQACWAGLAKTAFRAAWAGQSGPADALLLIGAGPVGQMLVRWAAARGTGRIAVVDLSATRLEYARKGGATELLHGDAQALLPQLRRVNGGDPPNLVIDATGHPKALQAALQAAAPFGKVILLGDCGDPSQQRLHSSMMTEGLTLQATHDSHDRDGWSERRVDAHFFKLLAAGRFPLDGMITHRFAPSQCESAYRLVEEQRDTAMGILFDWSLDS